MITGSPTPISGLPTGTLDNLQAIIPLDIGMPSLPQTIQASLLQVAQYLQSQGQMISGTYNTLSGLYMPSDGWTGISGSMTFVSSDSPSFVVTVNANVTGTVGVGMKLQLGHLNQTKYFIHTAYLGVTGSTTWMNLYGGTDYTLTTGSISNPKYSPSKSPYGFPVTPDKWQVTYSNATGTATQSSPASGTWYNLGGQSITIPIGSWLGYGEYLMQIAPTVVGSFKSTLSTANNTESNSANSVSVTIHTVTTTRLQITKIYPPPLNLTTKTQYFLNMQASQASQTSIDFLNLSVPTTIKFTSAYL